MINIYSTEDYFYNIQIIHSKHHTLNVGDIIFQKRNNITYRAKINYISHNKLAIKILLIDPGFFINTDINKAYDNSSILSINIESIYSGFTKDTIIFACDVNPFTGTNITKWLYFKNISKW